jgi:multiple sugar transport system ATP-binding protein
VAGFIGTPQMNLFDGELVVENGTYAVRVGDALITLSEDKQKNLAEAGAKAQKVIVGARPEHITLTEKEGSMIEGVVDVSEMMGSSVHLHINVGGKDCIIIAPRLDLDTGNLAVGSKIRFTLAPNAVHVFDPETEKNLERI